MEVVVVVVVVTKFSKRRMIRAYVVLCCLTVANFVFLTLGPFFFTLCRVISQLVFLQFLKVGGVLKMIFSALSPGGGPNFREDTIKKRQTFKVE